MRKVAAVLLMVLLLTGCASDAPKATTSTTAPEQGVEPFFPGLGGVMPEMTFNTADGEVLTLSGLLEEKKLVVLNFWFENCDWCIREFTVMEVAYQQYRQDVEIVALNPVDGADAVKAFSQNRSMSFPLAACLRSWAVESGISTYPTSIFIDRDGVVCLIHTGAITTTTAFYTLFDAFTGDDYERKIYGSIEELLL